MSRENIVPDEPGPHYPADLSQEVENLPKHRGESTETTHEPTHNHLQPIDPSAADVKGEGIELGDLSVSVWEQLEDSS